jgi:hypothetical protein
MGLQLHLRPLRPFRTTGTACALHHSSSTPGICSQMLHPHNDITLPFIGTLTLTLPNVSAEGSFE